MRKIRLVAVVWISAQVPAAALACSMIAEVGASRPAPEEMGVVPTNGAVYIDASQLGSELDAEIVTEDGRTPADISRLGDSFPRSVYRVKVDHLAPGQRFQLVVFSLSLNISKTFDLTMGSLDDVSPPIAPIARALNVNNTGPGDTCFAGDRFMVSISYEPAQDDGLVAAYVLNERRADGSLRALAASLVGRASPMALLPEDPQGRCFLIEAIDLAGQRSPSNTICMNQAPGEEEPGPAPQSPDDGGQLALDTQGGCGCSGLERSGRHGVAWLGLIIPLIWRRRRGRLLRSDQLA